MRVEVNVTDKTDKTKTFKNTKCEILTRDYRNTYIKLNNINILNHIEELNKDDNLDNISICTCPNVNNFEKHFLRLLEKRPTYKEEGGKIYFKDLELDMNCKTCYIKDRDMNLSRVEYSLLLILFRLFDDMISKEVIIKFIWGNDAGNKHYRLLSNTAVSLRKKLGRYGENLLTVKGYGYMFVVEPREWDNVDGI